MQYSGSVSQIGPGLGGFSLPGGPKDALSVQPSFGPVSFPKDRLVFPEDTRAAADESFVVLLTKDEALAYTRGLNATEEAAFYRRAEVDVDGLVRVEENLHDYRLSYAVPGLYHRLIVEHCGYESHAVLAQRFAEHVPGHLGDRRILDIAAGSGESGFQLNQNGAEFIVGLDLHTQARAAAKRDFPGVYRSYELGLAGVGLQTWMGKQEITDVFIAGGVNSNHAEALVQPAIDMVPVGGLICLTATQTPPRGEVRMSEAFRNGFFRGVEVIESASTPTFHRRTLVRPELQTDIFYDVIVAKKTF